MLSDLYNEALLEAAAQLPEARHLDNADARATKTSRVCGSTVSVEMTVAGGVVSDFAVEARACALGQASAALVAQYIIGTSTEIFKTVAFEVTMMLKSGGPAPSSPPWEVLEILAPIKEYPARHRSTLLVFEAVLDCLEQLKEK